MRKYFVLFLILTVVLFSFSTQTAKAGGVADFFNSVVNVVATIIGANFTSTIFSLAFFDPGLFLLVATDSLIRCDLLGQNSSFIEGCGTGTGVVLRSDISAQNLGSCNYQIPLTFYNQPEMNVSYGYPTSIQHDENGQPYTVTSNVCQQDSIDETNRKIAVYRFTLPANSDQNTLNNWYYGIQNNVGRGWLLLSQNYYQNGAESSKLTEADYITMCGSSDTCKFIDATVPPDVYVAYVAKILGSYNGLKQDSSSFENPPSCIPGDNKFLAKTTSGIAGNNLDATQISGPYKTTACPPPTVRIGAAPYFEIFKPDNLARVSLSWNSNYANSCSASGDWSGSKSIPNGSESLLKPRGDYSFTLSCSGNGGSASDTVTTRVIQMPRCDFSANPTSIILPKTSTLSWSCDYADTCSIDQGIGSVNNVSGSKEVRPSKTTTYILTCQGLDGSRSFGTGADYARDSTVKVGFTPIYKEVNPGDVRF